MMSSRPITPVSPEQSARPDASVYSQRGASLRGGSRPVSMAGTQPLQATDAASHLDSTQGYVQDPSATAQATDHDEVLHQDQEQPALPRTDSHMSQTSQNLLPSRGGTLKKRSSLHKSASLKRSASKRSSYAGSVRSMQLGEKEKYEETPESNSVFYCPVPTSGNPTELLANRFQGMSDCIA
jgi:hypothetical protein